MEFDAENRKRWSGEPPAPEDSRPRHDYSALWAEIQRCGVKTFGEPQAGNFRWPLNRSEAKARLDEFIAHVLPSSAPGRTRCTLRNLFCSTR
jgi:deoxyribodipyrimidine photolyase-related protein